MANGKDFFVELRKQVSALRQGGLIGGEVTTIEDGVT
jgi:hypothetical protein